MLCRSTTRLECVGKEPDKHTPTTAPTLWEVKLGFLRIIRRNGGRADSRRGFRAFPEANRYSFSCSHGGSTSSGVPLVLTCLNRQDSRSHRPAASHLPCRGAGRHPGAASPRGADRLRSAASRLPGLGQCRTRNEQASKS